ncbi:MAG: zinc-dependent metalloprotease, partial [bacterium]
MRTPRTLVVLALALVVTSSYAFAQPAKNPANETLVITSVGGQGNGDQKAAKKENDKDRSRPPSYRDKLESRGAPKAPPAPKAKPKYKPWKEVLKDAETHEGLFTIHTKREDVYFEIKEDQLDKPYLAIMSLSKGIGARMVLGGLPIGGSIMFDLHRVEDHIQIRRLNTRFRAEDNEALEAAIDLTFGNSVLDQFAIESENTDNKSLLVKMNGFFLSDISDVGYWLQMVLSKPVRLEAKKGTFSKIKAFPDNVEIETLMTYSPADRRGLSLPSVPDSRYIEIGVHYSLHKLPEKPMKPRIADDRVGYFVTPFKDFTRDDKDNFFVHYCNRWRLEKADPTAELSEPVKPIVYYVDHTVPLEYRRYVREGIEMWQKAFERAGFKNAIIAKDAPSPEEDPEYDPEDARYNTIRWIVSDAPSFGAIGPSRVDPRTGEILDADVLIEQNMIMGFRMSYRRFAGPLTLEGLDPTLQYLKDPETDPEAAERIEMMRNTLGCCDRNFGIGFSQGFDFLQLALLTGGSMDPGMKVPQEFIGEAIKFVTCHEVGHTLGLRHNFKSSTATPFDKLNDRYTVSEIGLTGSIMDYPSPNVSRDRSRQGYYYSPSVGTWDEWAVEWGYTEVPGDMTPEREQTALRKIADKASLKENTYGTDEDTYPAGALDPLSAIWDLSDDPLAWAVERIGVCEDILAKGDLEERVVGEESNYVPLRYAAQTLLMQEYLAVGRAIKYVGGQYTARPHRGDGSGELPLEPVPPEKQREALEFIVEKGFSPGAFALPPEMLNRLADNKARDWQNQVFAHGRRFDFPMIGWVSAIQNALLMQLLQPMLLQRVNEAEYTVDDPYRLSELFGGLTDAIWYNNMIPEGRTAIMQRNLQRTYLDYLIRMTVRPISGTPHEAIALARLHLTRLDSRLEGESKKQGLSDEAVAHLIESRARIKRALDANLQSSF